MHATGAMAHSGDKRYVNYAQGTWTVDGEEVHYTWNPTEGGCDYLDWDEAADAYLTETAEAYPAVPVVLVLLMLLVAVFLVCRGKQAAIEEILGGLVEATKGHTRVP